MTFLDDLPGIRDLQVEDGAVLPRRNRLAFFGVEIADNPITGSTDVTFDGAPVAMTVTLALDDVADTTPLTDAAIESANVLRLDPSTDLDVRGLDVSAPPRVVLVNVSSHGLTILHESGSAAATARILCPGQTAYALDAGDSVELVRDPVSARWRLVR